MRCVGFRAAVLAAAILAGQPALPTGAVPEAPAASDGGEADEAADDDATVLDVGLLPGWEPLAPEKPAASARGDAPPRAVLPLASVAMGVGAAARVETGLAVGPDVPTFAEVTVRALVRSAGAQAYGVAMPLLFGPDPDGAPLGTGNLALEGHWRLSRQDESEAPAWYGALRLIFPAGNRSGLFLLIPGRTRTSGGVEGVAALRWVFGAWSLHTEVGGGSYIDDLMALRLGITAALSRHLAGPLHLFAQLDPWAVWVPRPTEVPGAGASALAQLGAAGGLRLRVEPVEITLAYQRLVPHTNDHHLWLAVELQPQSGP